MAFEPKSATGCRPGTLFGLWCILPERLERYVSVVQGLDFLALAKAHAERSDAAAWDPDDGLPKLEFPAPPTSEQGGTPPVSNKPYPMTRDGIAIIRISGPTTKYTTSFSDAIGGTATVAVQRMVRMAAADPDVRGIMIHLDDAPGGTVAGAFELADDLIAAGEVKPVRAHGDDCCCSAAMLFASATSRVTANQTGHVGSIGVRADMVDMSEKFSKEGVKVIPIVSGKYKAAGAPGTKVTDDYIADQQRKVDKLNDLFVSYVADGRPGLTEKAIRDFEARVYLADEAKVNGLIDDVCSLEEAIGAFSADLDKQAGTTTPRPTQRTTTAPNAGKGNDMELLKLLAAAGLAATMAEGDALTAIGKMRADLDAANAKLRTPEADVLGDRMGTVLERIDARVESGMPVPAARAIKAAIGVPNNGDGDVTKATPNAAVLTPVAALGNKTVAAWAVDLFKPDLAAGSAEAGEKTPAQPTGTTVQEPPKREAGGRTTGNGNGAMTPEREAELLGLTQAGREVLDARTGRN